MVCRMKQFGLDLRTGTLVFACVALGLSIISTIHTSRLIHRKFEMMEAEVHQMEFEEDLKKKVAYDRPQEEAGGAMETGEAEGGQLEALLQAATPDEDAEGGDDGLSMEDSMKKMMNWVAPNIHVQVIRFTEEEMEEQVEREKQEHKMFKEAEKAIVAVSYVGEIFMMVASLFAIVGVYKQNHRMLIAFIISLIIDTGILLFLAVGAIIKMARRDDFNATMACKCGGGVILGFLAAQFVLAGVVSYYRELKEAAARGNQEDDKEMLVPVVDEKDIVYVIGDPEKHPL